MPDLPIEQDLRIALRARSHHLDPVVLLGLAGLTDAALREIDRALDAHELIKIRVPGDDRAQRRALLAQIADRLGAAPIQAIGKLLVVYRPRPLISPTPPGPSGARNTTRRTRKSGQAGQTRPRQPRQM